MIRRIVPFLVAVASVGLLAAPGAEGAAFADAVHRTARFDGSGLREAKALLAAAALEAERYPL